MKIPKRCLSLIAGFAFLLLAHPSAQQMPPPRPKPSAPEPAKPRPKPAEKEKAPEATLLITADTAATISVDANEIGSFAQDEVRPIRVGLGQHLVRAVAGDLKWEQVVTADKAVQMVVRTGLVEVKAQRDNALAARAAQQEETRRAAEAEEARRREAATAKANPAGSIAVPAANEASLLGYVPNNPLQIGSPGKDVVYVPTPAVAAYAMLQLAKVGPDDTVYDLGSGDGRLVIMAAKHFGARGVGIEYNSQLNAIANQNARAAGVADRVTFRTEDLFQSNLSGASVITMFLLPSINSTLRPKLQRLPPGTRIVSNTFDIEGWPSEKEITVKNCSSWCTARLWIVPQR